MNNKIRKIISFLVVLITIANSAIPAFALSFENGQVITLEKDHDCISVLKFKGEDLLKGITYVVYKDQETGREQPAFCVEPDKSGIGTGAGDSYDVTLSLLRDQKLWRVLYKGYMGSKYTNWGLQCSDDLYYATKTAIHCLVEGVAPVDKYEVPNRVGWGENVSLAEVQKRGAKVLEVAQTLYNYGMNGGDNYLTPELYINRRGEMEEQTINGENYLVQKFYLTGNREIYTYRVDINNFPEGTKILNSANVETDLMKNVTFKIAVPISKIKENISGDIKIVEAKAKSYPIFFAKSYIEELQSYVTYADNVEDVTTDSTLNIDAYKSEIEIIKTDEETGNKLSGVTFNVKYSDTNQNIGDFTTDNSGKISITGLRQGKITITEKATKEEYVLDATPVEVELEYKQIKQIDINNVRKKGNLKIIKIDKDNNKITIPNVEFQLLDSNKNVIGKYKTDSNGEINIEGLKTGQYVLKETATLEEYCLLDEEIEVNVNWNETTEIKIENELKKGNLKVIKVDKEDNTIIIPNVEFELLDSKNNLVGKYKTNSKGEINIEGLKIGEYVLKEISTPSQYYPLDGEINIQINWNETTEMKIENKLKEGQIKIVKVDKENKEIKLEGLVFEVLNEEGKLLETIVTDKNGEAITQKYSVRDYENLVIREIETQEEYVLESTPVKVKLECDQIKEIYINNSLKKGNLRVIKIDKDNHKIAIPNVEFKLFDSNKKLVGEYKTNENGEINIECLKIGKYVLKETKTDSQYFLLKDEIDVQINWNEITEIKIENEKINLKVNVEKTGFSEAENNQNIYYDFKNIQNNSNVELSNFTWTDTLPTDAVRIDKILTGTWNQELEYSVWYKTNKNDYRVIAENLSTNINNEIDFSNIVLKDDEYIIEYEFRFGTVSSGFSEIEQPRLYCKVIDNLTNGLLFTNNTRVRGGYLNQYTEHTDYWTTIIYNKEKPLAILPRTGM